MGSWMENFIPQPGFRVPSPDVCELFCITWTMAGEKSGLMALSNRASLNLLPDVFKHRHCSP